MSISKQKLVISVGGMVSINGETKVVDIDGVTEVGDIDEMWQTSNKSEFER